MLVYGDPSFEATLGDLLAALRGALAVAHGGRSAAAGDQIRALLILAGQVEQAAEDGLPAAQRRQQAALRAATEHAAAAFHACALADADTARATAQVAAALGRMAGALDGCGFPMDVRLTVKLPEGFACYALYPEQYGAAADRWLADHAAAAPRRVLVVGLRSIGCSLSAVVAAALAAGGWEVRRVTARPTGHPYARTVALPPEVLGDATHGLVVDEGPGYSGSSMAAAARALAAAGLPAERISFFPGHAAEPGAGAAAEVRAWWGRVPRYVAPLEALRLAGRPLAEALAEAALRLSERRAPVVAVEDLGGGGWRRLVYAEPGLWSALGAAFERPKYRCTLADGRRILWKFGGLAWLPGAADGALLPGAESDAARQAARASAGWSPPPLGVAHGFVATPWLDGRPLTLASADVATLAHLGRYLAASAGPPLGQREQEAALERLRAILRINAGELLGEAAATRAAHWARAATTSTAPVPASGDGRLAPHEWLRALDGRLWKVDSVGHEWDHTPIGRQGCLWDLAGALVEWGLAGPAADALLSAYRQAGGAPPAPAALAFHRAAYAAYRAGQCHWCAAGTADPAERARLDATCQRYTTTLARLLAVGPV